jgi:hypothetical protein
MSWSEKYKKSIDCNNPKGFSQKAHCQGEKKRLNFNEFKEPLKFSKFTHKTKHFGKTIHQLDPNLDLKHLVHHSTIEYLDKDADGDVDIFDKINTPDESPDKDFEKTSKKLIKKQKGEIEHSKKKIAYYEGTLHHWFKGSKSKDGKPGWVQADGSPCANEPGETKTPKCFSSGRLKSLKKKGKKGESLIRSAVRRKRQKDKNQQSKSGAAKPTMVKTFAKGKKDPNYIKAEPGIKESMELNEARKDKPGKGSGTKDACYHKVKSRYSVWPSAYASGALVKCRKVGASNWGESVEMIRYCPKCKKEETRNECKYGSKYWDMFSMPIKLKDYTPNTPHPGTMPESKDHEYSMARSEISTIISAAKRLRKKMKGEGNIEAWVQSKITKAADYLDSAADYVDSGEMSEQVKPVEGPYDKFDRFVNAAKLTSNPKTKVKILKKAATLYPIKDVDEQMLPPINPEAHKRLQKTQKLYNKGTSTDNPNEKEIFLKRTGPQLPLAWKKKKSELQVAHYEFESELIEYSNWRADFGLSEDWQKVNRQDKTDGLSQKAVDAYRRENPGSKLQTAVTEKKPSGKRAKRRANFCRRMKGMKSKLTSSKTARDPDSRINKALRRWRCN